MNVERMQLGSGVDNTPMLIAADLGGRHGCRIRRKLAAVDVEAVLVLGKGNHEVWCGFLQRLNINWLINRRTVVNSVLLLRQCFST